MDAAIAVQALSIVTSTCRMQGRYKPSLATLTKRHLNRDIQAGQHSSVEDAVATLHLVKLKVNKGPTYGCSPPRLVAVIVGLPCVWPYA